MLDTIEQFVKTFNRMLATVQDRAGRLILIFVAVGLIYYCGSWVYERLTTDDATDPNRNVVWLVTPLMILAAGWLVWKAFTASSDELDDIIPEGDSSWDL